MKAKPKAPHLYPLHTRLTAAFVLTAFAHLTFVAPVQADILRGGSSGGGTAPSGGGGSALPSTPADTTRARENAQDALARTSNTLNSLRAMQDAARQAAQTTTDPLAPGLPTVPNGLGVGGLNPHANAGIDPSVWSGAELPEQSINADGLINVGIRQTAQQALLDWQTFNIGRETTLNFDQSAAGANAAQWIAFNRINDPSGNPTQILGNINAQGQVYVINRNGVIFGGSSQVDVNTLTISSLPINTNLIERGLLNNPDSQFLFSGINLPAGPNGTPAFTPEPPPSGTGRYGDVIIQAGAEIRTPVSADGNGGRVFLVGPNVSNEGSILTPAGQTILAAGLQVGIAPHAATDPTLRGLDVYVGQVGAYGGRAENTGIISAQRGNITIVGRDVVNNGALAATTSVSLNGRIDLLAHYGATSNPATGSAGLAAVPFLNRESGIVSLGADSLLSILPEYGSTETTIGTELALRSIINIQGRDILFGQRSTLFAPNAIVSVDAGEWYALGGVTPSTRFIQSAGRIDIGEDSLLNVAGSVDVEVSVAQNIIEVDLRGAELANSPLQREGPLRGQSVTVDIRDVGIYQQAPWIGTPLAEIGGFANLIQRDVAQLTAAGGSIRLSAGQSTVIREGAVIDVSGGSISWQDAVVNTTRLIRNGQIINIRDAAPDVIYDGIYDGSFDASSQKWSVEQIYQVGVAPDGSRLEYGYLEGAAGGSLVITSPAMALDGTLLGHTYPGENQRVNLPAASSLTLNFTAIDRSFVRNPVYAPTPPAITFVDSPSQVSPGAFGGPLDAARIANVLLPSSILTSGGFRNFTLNNPDGSITLPVGTTLQALSRANLDFRASNISILGSIIAPGASVSLRAPNFTLSQLDLFANTSVTTTPSPNPGRGRFTLGQNGLIDTSGVLIDDRANSPTAGSVPLVLGGGSVNISAYDVILNDGGIIDVSGGARADARGRISYGNAGSISVSGGRDINVPSVLGGALVLESTMSGFSGARGGSLTLNGPAFQIGGASAPAGVNHLDPGFFSRGGFATFSLSGIGLATGTPNVFTPGVLIADGTEIRSVVQNRLAVAPVDQAFVWQSPLVQPEGVRDTASITLRATGATSPFTSAILTRGEVVMGSGSSIITDAGGSVTLAGQATTVLGHILTPGGTINLSGAASFPAAGDPPLFTTLVLGSSAVLDASGKTVLVPDPFGLRTGRVFAGGNISLSGNILAQSGSMILSHGASGILDLVPAASTLSPGTLASLKGRLTTPVTVETSGGTITLAGSSFLHSDATLAASAGGASANGGNLIISSSRFVPPNTSSTTADINLVVTSGTNVTSASNPAVTGTRPLDENGAQVAGLGRISTNSFTSGGFHNLTLGGNVRFQGDVSINMPGTVRLASGGVIESNGAVSINADHIHAGQSFRPPSLPGEIIEYFTINIPGVGIQAHNFTATTGAGDLSLAARLIDLGTLSLQNTGNASFLAPTGDIRGNGILQAAANLNFTAGQLYPTTASPFSIFAYGGSTITFNSGSARALPFSAGGTLNVHAANIVQNGTLRAPIGNINLGWNGAAPAPVNPITGNLLATPITTSLVLGASSVTSVSAIDPITGNPAILPFGISFDGESWLSPSGIDITTLGPPSKDIKISALDVETESGSIIDISGGGDLFAYRWVSGNGGTRDVLGSSNSFAVIPGYAFDYAPYANLNSTALGGQSGYANSTLRPGDQITLGSGSGVPAGTYTLLPARYALLPGAFLVTPIGGTPTLAAARADGSHIITGYTSNNLSAGRTGITTITNFEVAPAETFRQRADYRLLSANKFFTDFAASRDLQVPRLPTDAGILSFTATTGLRVAGSVAAATAAGSRGALIDINSPVDILINATGTGGVAGQLVLSAPLLNSFNADSLLIGGIRSQSGGEILVNTSTNNITLDNEDAELLGNDIILTARQNLTLAEGASIRATGSRAVGSITLGNPAVAGSGNGALVRVSGSPDSGVIRRSVIPGGAISLNIGENASLQGTSIILDSTAATNIAASAAINGSAVSVSSGEISLLLENPGTLEPTSGAVIGGDALNTLLASTDVLTLRSYSNINLYGTGQIGSADFDSLTFQAAAILGRNQNGGDVTLAARNLTLSNPLGSASATPAPAADGTLTFSADTLTLSTGNIRTEGFSNIALTGADQVRAESTGSFNTSANLAINTSVLTGGQAAKYAITTTGSLTHNPLAAGATVAPGFGAELSLTGATVALNGGIRLPSGRLQVSATTGDVVVSGNLDLAGISRQFVDVTRHTSGGSVSLASAQGSVLLAASSVINLSAPAAAGNAGTLDISVPNGALELLGTITASAGANGTSGKFTLDASTLSSLATLDAALNTGSFFGLRDYRARSGNVLIDGNAIASTYRVSADQGDITVSGTIDASGNRGGTIDLKANGSLTLLNGALLDASAQQFDAAGKGGSIFLEAGSQREGVVRADALLDLQIGSVIDLAVAAHTAQSASLGQFQGSLHLRAPRNTANSDLAIAAIGSSITGASAITVEGYRLYDRTATGTLDNSLLTTIGNDSTAFMATANYNAMLARLTSIQPALDLILMPGAEIINRTGSLTLGSQSSAASNDWNLATMRYGPRSAPGVLTLRAAGDIALFNAISDGFNGGTDLWRAPLLAYNPLLPANSQSWSYRFTAGADFTAASFRSTADPSSLAPDTGHLRLGKNTGAATVTGGSSALTSSIVPNNYQVIRTGSGDIDIHTARAIRFLNPFASIYTAGTQVADPTGVHAPGDFITPIINRNVSQVVLGNAQQNYGAQYSMAGGNVNLHAGTNIERLTVNNSGLIQDSSRQLPNNWLYRRSYVNPDGEYGIIRIGSGFTSTTDPAASATWWVDFSNFFQSVGALGGGNITLTAGNDIRNTDAAIPTNARAPRGVPNPASVVELGGGDLVVRAGKDISGGVYYVERGQGNLEAGGAITTNATRSPSSGLVGNLNSPATSTLDPQTWMPTTLFVGKSSFNLQAAGDITLGPISNPFLLPQGINNRFWYKTHFSTYSEDSSVSAISLGGDLSYRNAIILPGQTQAIPMLRAWHETQLLFTNSAASTSFVQPWLRLTESDLSPFSPIWSLAPASVSLTAFSGDMRVAGDLTTFPSPLGQIELIAAGSFSALQPVGLSNVVIPGQTTRAWTSSIINLSDADPRSIPRFQSPLNTGNPLATGATFSATTTAAFMSSLASMFVESGSFTGTNAVLQTRQARHTSGLLHPVDADPVRIHAMEGDISGLTLFTGKPAWITAGRDITDIAFYLQNTDASHLSIVSAARDIIAANPLSVLRIAATAAGNALAFGQSLLPGDIQISGPGALHVLAGRNLDLGTGSSLGNGTGAGLSSIGNFRNPFLGPQGADITALAGIGPASELASSMVAIDAFIQHLLDTPEGFELLDELIPGVDPATLDPRTRATLAIEAFFITLRDAGRDYNNPQSPDVLTYRLGEAAIAALFGEDPALWNGDMLVRARDIRTRSGGDIRLLVPGGGLSLANTAIGNPLTPPGIITEAGGSINIFTDENVDIGVGRIFTLRGGDIIIWSSNGDIAAGTSSRTVQSAPPTRVVIDPQSASVQTDLAGLATGGGIGVLATVEGVEPGDVDLIAPTGTIDAGDAGIRVSGNINIAAVQVVNAGNIASGGSSTGGGAVSAPAVTTVSTPAPPVSQTTAAETTAREEERERDEEIRQETGPSIYTVEVIGYGGGGPIEEEEEENTRPQAEEEEAGEE